MSNKKLQRNVNPIDDLSFLVKLYLIAILEKCQIINICQMWKIFLKSLKYNYKNNKLGKQIFIEVFYARK